MIAREKTKAKRPTSATAKRGPKTGRVSDRTPPDVRQAQILAYVEANGSSDSKVVAEALGGHIRTVRKYADRLCEARKIHCTRVRRTDGGTDVLYHLGEGPAVVFQKRSVANQDCESANRLVRKTWEPYHHRDLWACAMFPVPSVLLEQRA